jgi:hypothetical protein
MADRSGVSRDVAWSACSDSTYTLKIVLEPADLSLRPGMNARVEILTE